MNRCPEKDILHLYKSGFIIAYLGIDILYHGFVNLIRKSILTIHLGQRIFVYTEKFLLSLIQRRIISLGG